MINKRKKIVFLTGAGISVESGIKAFRDKDGLWGDEKLKYLASTDALYENLPGFLDFYNARRLQLAGVEPNEAHRMIAALEKHYDVTVITQNVDDLHERAGSTDVIHLHGELTKVCSSQNRHTCVKDYPLTTPIKMGDTAEDGSQLRPYIVLFGEYVSNMELAEVTVECADMFVVIGTSLVVYPAAGLLQYARKDIPKFIIDPNDIESDKAGDYYHIKQTATEGMRMLLKSIEKLHRTS